MRSAKLVRDKIPDIMESKGKNSTFHIANENQFYDLLKNKLLEEVNEFLENDSTEELCDILEVIYAICASKKISPQELDQLRIKKAKERGSFTKRLILETQNK
jgi:predicted house-cleaning noncanonical NTP pyrophosphatase (MazG superfamily)